MSVESKLYETVARKKLKLKFDELVQKYLDEHVSDRSIVLHSRAYDKVIQDVREARRLRMNKKALPPKLNRRFKRYNVISVGGEEKLIEKSMKTGVVRYYCRVEELFDAVDEVHLNTGHRRTRVMEAELKKKYCNITRGVIAIYLSLCPYCGSKQGRTSQTFSIRQVMSKNLNLKSQVSTIDMTSQPDGEYKFIFRYQEMSTRFMVLRPLKTTTPEELISTLVDVFCMIGAPRVLQADLPNITVAAIMQALSSLWQGIRVVVHKPKSQQTSAIDGNVKAMLNSWTSVDNCMRWSEVLKFIQHKRNNNFHVIIRRSPFEAMFSISQRTTLIDPDRRAKLRAQEEMKEVLNEMNIEVAGGIDWGSENEQDVVVEENEDDSESEDEEADLLNDVDASDMIKCSNCGNFLVEDDDGQLICAFCKLMEDKFGITNPS